jgi:hypothetical protein
LHVPPSPLSQSRANTLHSSDGDQRSASQPVRTLRPLAVGAIFARILHFGRRPRERTIGADAGAAMTGEERSLSAIPDAPAATVAERPRKAMKPLPWGRDFAATSIHRDDTLTAIFGKLEAADSPRVALVAPRGNHELSKALGMRRLRRHADLSGKDVMIVTRSGSLRSRARDVGLATTGSLRGVDFERYGRSGLRVGSTIVPLPGLGLFLRMTAFLVAIAALAAVVLLYLPDATVQVYPQFQTLASTPNLIVASDVATPNATSGEIPGHRRSLTVSTTLPFPVYGQTTIKAPDGSDQTVPAASDDDLKRAMDFAQRVLLNQGRATLEQRYKGETLFPQSAIVSAFDATPNVRAGEAAQLLQVTASGQVTMLSTDNDTLRSVLEGALKQNVQRGEMWLPETFAATTLSAGDFDKTNNRLPVRMKLSEGVTRSFSITALRKAVAGKSKRDAQQAIVERVDQMQPASIKLQPGWAPWLPRFTSRITIHVRQPGSSDAAGTAGKPAASPTPTPAPR